jgi:hypothetical protein
MTSASDRPARLTKGKFVTGLRCPKLLWLSVHEPGAPELVEGDDAGSIRAKGNLVGVRAREEFPGGGLIDRAALPPNEQLEQPRLALNSFDRAVFEAGLAVEGFWASADILIPMARRQAWNLVEVKGSQDTGDHHILDAALQTHVARRAGVDIQRLELDWSRQEDTKASRGRVAALVLVLAREFVLISVALPGEGSDVELELVRGKALLGHPSFADEAVATVEAERNQVHAAISLPCPHANQFEGANDRRRRHPTLKLEHVVTFGDPNHVPARIGKAHNDRLAFNDEIR